MSERAELTVLVFGPQALLVGGETLTLRNITLPTTAAELLTRIGENYPALRDSVRHSHLAVNHRFAEGTEPISGAEEIALIGLVSGG